MDFPFHSCNLPFVPLSSPLNFNMLLLYYTGRLVVCTIIGLVLMSTIYDLLGWGIPVSDIDKKSSILVEKKSTKMQVFQCFSAVRNINEWLSVKTAAVDEISCLHGLRVLTLLLIFYIHTTEVIFFLSRPIHQEYLIQVNFSLKKNIFR